MVCVKCLAALAGKVERRSTEYVLMALRTLCVGDSESCCACVFADEDSVRGLLTHLPTSHLTMQYVVTIFVSCYRVSHYLHLYTI